MFQNRVNLTRTEETSFEVCMHETFEPVDIPQEIAEPHNLHIIPFLDGKPCKELNTDLYVEACHPGTQHCSVFTQYASVEIFSPLNRAMYDSCTLEVISGSYC